MYSIVVQNDLLLVTAVYVRDTLLQIQELLEELEPGMDAEYLTAGLATVASFNDKIYSFHAVLVEQNVA